MKDERIITIEILKDNGFEDTTDQNMKNFWESSEYGVKDYSSWHRDTFNEDKDKYIILDFSKGVVNKYDAEWGLHLDNKMCNSIGSADISYVWQFNMFMELMGSSFRLK